MPYGVVLVFVHGFRGRAEQTFGAYPARLRHLVRETHPGVPVEAVIYPTYETRGSLGALQAQLDAFTGEAPAGWN